MNAKQFAATIAVATMLALAMGAAAIAGRASRAQAAAQTKEGGFEPLFNGRDLTGWKVPAGDNGHWRVTDGAIDYDAESQAAGEKSLWTEREFKDFVLRLDWRIKSTP